MSDDLRILVAGLSLFGGVVSLLCSGVCVFWALDARKSAGRYLLGEDDEQT